MDQNKILTIQKIGYPIRFLKPDNKTRKLFE